MFEKNATKEFKKQAVGIIILGCIIMYFSSCLSTDAMNIIQPTFIEKFGWAYSDLSMPITIAGYILIGLSFLYSTIVIKKGTRAFGVVGLLAAAIGTVLIALAYGSNSEAYMLYFVGALLTRLATTAIQIVIFQLCVNWFVKSRGRILGIVTMAAPLNSATSVTLMTIGKENIGFQFTYFVVATILVASAILAYFYAITNPDELGVEVDGIKGGNVIRESSEDEKATLTMKEILRNPATWQLTITFGIFSGTIGTVMAFFITRMGQVDVSVPTALSILAGASILGIPLSYLFGWIDDKFGTLKACRVLGISYILMMVCFYFGSADNFIMILGAAVGMAAMTGGTPNLHPSSIMSVFGKKEYQNANRYIAVGLAVISANGMQLMSQIFDKTGSLDMGYVAFGVLALIATISVWFVKENKNTKETVL